MSTANPDESGPGEQDSQDQRLRAAISGTGHLSRRLFQVHARLWQDRVQDLTGPQFTTLGVLHLEGPMDQRTLGGHARLDKSTTTPLLERLQQRGLIEIVGDAEDRRRKILRITPAGSELVMRVAPAATEVGDEMLAPLSEAERAEFLGYLERIC